MAIQKSKSKFKTFSNQSSVSTSIIGKIFFKLEYLINSINSFSDKTLSNNNKAS
jgi:hypothetical protein